MPARRQTYRMPELLLVITLANTVFRVSTRTLDEGRISGLCTRYSKWECKWIAEDSCPPHKVNLSSCPSNRMIDCTEWMLRSGIRFCSCECGSTKTGVRKYHKR
ncbi:uncharacterized protein LOC142587735 isoform X1 [Dermacentor variabilis]|uniref:uncharacterized protein LOC142587735 isoform X1 n=2 Tax=Dermacentor variabilis TaxID=34621 RepID=UPI003F5B778C